MLKFYKKYNILLCCVLCISAANIINGQNTNTADNLKQELLKTKSDTARIGVLYKLADYYYRKEPSIALNYANEALQLAEQTKYDDNLHISILNLLGTIYLKKADYPKALSYYFQNIRLLRKLNRESEIVYALNNIGTCYLALKQYETAKKYLIESLNMWLKQNISKGIENIYNNIGIASIELGQLQESVVYYRKAIEANSKHPAAYINLGEAYMKLQQLQQAEYYYKKGLHFNDSNDIYGMLTCYESLGRLYIKKRDFKSAEGYLFKAKEIAEQSGVIIIQADIYASIVELYEEQSDFKNAHIYNKQLQQLKDSIFKEQNTRQMNEIQAQYELEKKDKDIQLLNKDKEITRSNILLQKFFIGGLICILIIGVIIVRNIVLKQKLKAQQLKEEKTLVEKNNQLLHQYNKELSKENVLAKYEVLKSKINPHFLFNSLTTLSSIVIENPRQAVTYIESFSELYRLILETGEHHFITLKQEVEILEHYIFLQKIRFDTQLQITIEIEEEDMYKMIPPFAIQMLIENVIKHNKVSKGLMITIKSNEDGLWVINNRHKKTGMIASTGMGHSNITERYKMVGNQLPKFTAYEDKYVVNLPLISKAVTTMQTMEA